jgi:hypothetical protein
MGTFWDMPFLSTPGILWFLQRITLKMIILLLIVCTFYVVISFLYKLIHFVTYPTSKECSFLIMIFAMTIKIPIGLIQIWKIEIFLNFGHFTWIWHKIIHLYNVKLIRYQFWCTRCAFQLIKSLQWCSSRKYNTSFFKNDTPINHFIVRFKKCKQIAFLFLS